MSFPTRWIHPWTTGVPHRRSVGRARWIGFVLFLVLVPNACGRRAPAPPAPDFTAELVAGARYAERLAARQRGPAAAMSDEEVIASGYLERLRVGLGSPFRLMEYALRDPRLTPAARASLTWAMLDATRAGRGYQIDPGALTRIGIDARGRSSEAAAAHLALIEGVVGEGDDPRIGELAVREAYRLAAASGAVSSGAAARAASVAALLRDREFARRDAVRLLAAGARGAKHPFVLIAERRSGRRLEVQLPAGAPHPSAVDEAAAERATALVGRIEEIARAPGVRSASRPVAFPPLTARAARRLANLARTQSYPTQSPVWITVRSYREQLQESVAGDRAGERAVERLLDRSRNEETLIAEQARAWDAAPDARRVLALVAVEAGVAMRAYAQEKVWFAGSPAPSAIDLKRVYGLRRVEFDGDVPISWRPYYRRMLGDALADLELVLPSLDLQGATFRIGSTGMGGVALATHDPNGRIIHLPPESGAGAIAHEVGHDLDWQVAHARYGTQSSYGTEYVLQTGRGDPFAAAVRRMPVPPEIRTRGDAELQRRYTQHPPEIFARTFEGYIAAALGERGRGNGYLTTAQDEFLGGYGLALMPGTRRGAAEPFMELLMFASPVPEPSRRAFLGRWGDERVPSGFDVAHRISAGARALPPRAPRRGPGMMELLAAGASVRADLAEAVALRDSALAEWSVAAGANPLAARGRRGQTSVRTLANAALAARARGIVTAHARALGLDDAPGWLRTAWLGSPPRPAPLFGAHALTGTLVID